MEDIEKKNLKNYAIKQEKLKMFEERRKINKQNKEEREVLKLKKKLLRKHWLIKIIILLEIKKTEIKYIII